MVENVSMLIKSVPDINKRNELITKLEKEFKKYLNRKNELNNNLLNIDNTEELSKNRYEFALSLAQISYEANKCIREVNNIDNDNKTLKLIQNEKENTLNELKPSLSNK